MAPSPTRQPLALSLPSCFTFAALALWGLSAAAAAQVQDLAARASADGRTAYIRWTTRSPTRCKIEYGSTAAYGRTAGEDPSSLRGTTNNRDSGVGYANNHRVDLPMPEAGELHYRFVVQDREGKTTRSPDRVISRCPAGVSKAGVNRVRIRIDRGKWRVPEPPVVVGVPFPPGHLASADQLRLVSKGEEIASQVEVVSRYWQDGSMKWVRVAFMAPKGANELMLEYGAGVRRREWPVLPAQPAPRLEIARRLTPVLTDSQGKQYRGVADEEIVEERGSNSVTLRSSGHHVADDGSKLFAYVMRVHLFAGKPYARIDYTFENDATDREMTSIKSLDLVLKAAGKVRVLTDAGPIDLAPGERVFQREDFEWADEAGKRRGKRLPGIVELPDAGARVMVKNFWQQYPKAIETRGDDLVLSLLPALPKDFYANRKDEDKLYYYIRDGLYTFRQGFAKTHELWVDFSGDDAARSLIADAPTACVDPQWIEDSGALRGLGVAVRGQFPGYDEAFRAMAEGILVRRERYREYGMMNFGDWYGERTWNWGNLEYDLGHGLLTQFARTGDGRFFRRAREALRHERDVDTRHDAKDPRRVGQQWAHCMGHTAGYYPYTYKNMKVYASRGWSDNRGHIWAQGMLEHYLLGGGRRSWETGRLIADWAAGPQTTNFRFGNAREPGWMLKLVMSAYDATGDPYYLNGARLMIRKVREMSEASGKHGFYYHKLPKGHCNCEKKHYGEAGFMLGVLMTGMKMYYDATGDARVADDIVGIAKFIADTMWVEDRCAFRYTSCPQTRASHGSAWIMMEGLAFAAARSGDAKLQRVCRDGLAAAWGGLGSGGKSSGYRICSSAQAIYEFAKVPGPSFKEYQERMAREMASPARRALPTLLHNPDFEEFIDGWPPRTGAAISLSTDVKHSGRQALKIEGKLVRQNEYVNTTYDSAADPAEIKGLAPGQTYRLTCWLRVDKLSPGAAAPSVRLAFRDDMGTKGSSTTNAYDLAKMGAWQKLSVDAKIPAYNTRNYIALNTNTREPLEALLYLDDVSLVPAALASKDTYAYVRLDPTAARKSPGLEAKETTRMVRRQWYVGRGAAGFRFTAPADATYVVWIKADGKGDLGAVSIDGRALAAVASKKDGWQWLRLGEAALTRGAHELRLDVRGERLGRIVVTDDPSAAGG